MSVTLSLSAADRVKHFLQKEGGSALRLGVRKTGCSGWAYTVDLALEVLDTDEVFEDQGITVVVDKTHLQLLDGTEIDFVSEGLNRSFRFRNPNVTNECGCGESFTVN